MRILVIGGTNFIGPHLVRRLAELGHEVALFHRGQTQAELPASVRHVLGDRHQLAEHRDAFRRLSPEIVVDMIAYTREDADGLVATFRGLARRIVVLSSGDVYRAHGRLIGTEPGPVEPTPLTEDAPLRAVGFPYRSQARGPDDFVYSYDKIPVEQTVRAEPALPATVLRLPMVYGPGDYQHRLYPYLRRMDDGRRAILLDEGLARWRCTRGYVEDVAAAIALAAGDDRAAGRVHNVGEAVALTEADWVRAIGEAAGWQGQVVTVPAGRLPVPGDMRQDIVTDTRRIREELGYRENGTLADRLRQAVAWERPNPPAEPPAFDYPAEDRLLQELGL